MSPDDSTARVPLGPVGGYLIENLKELRAARRLTYKDLADRLTELGLPIPTLGLSRIEKRTRRVDVDDLVALALALGVNPTALLLPRTDNGGAVVSLTTSQQATAEDVWAWASGEIPLPAPDSMQELADFEKHSKPWWLNRGVVRQDQIPEIQKRLDEQQRQLDLLREQARLPRPKRVAAAIVVSGEGVLITRRLDGKPPWGFVTGEVEPGERYEDAAVREVKEETGLEVRVAGEAIGRRSHPVTGVTMIYIPARPVRGTDVFVGDEAELAEVKWASLDEALSLLPDMFEPVREYLAAEL